MGRGRDDFENCWRSGRLLRTGPLARSRVPGPGPGPKPKYGSEKIKVFRRKKNVLGGSVCPNRSVSSSHYDRTEFRLTENSKPRIGERVPPKNLENISKNLNLPNLDPYFPNGMALFFEKNKTQ